MRVAVIAGTPQLVRAARDLGVGTVFVHDDAVPRPDVEADVVLAGPLDDPVALNALLAPLHENEPFDRVISLTETGLVPAAEAADRLGVAGNPLRAVRLLQDKSAMRALLDARGLSPVAAAVPIDVTGLEEFCRRIDGPAILKPAGGSGSHAVFRVDTPEAASAAWAGFIEAGGVEPIAEEYLLGPEVSVEGFSCEGAHIVIAITDKRTQSSFVEVGHTMPAALAASTEAEVIALTRAFLTAIGLVEGPSHTEVKLTARGPRIIESHNRIGGDKIRDLVRLAYGIDLVALTVGAPLGLLEPPATDPVPRGGAAIRFLTPEPGVVKAIRLPDTTPEDTRIAIDARVGDLVGPVRRSQDRAGYVLAGGSDALDAARRCERVVADVVIETG